MKTVIRRNRDALLGAASVAIASAILGCQFAGLTLQLTDEPLPPSSGGVPAASGNPECLPGIVPGKTTREETLALLGNPLGTNQEGGVETLSYASAILKQFNSVVVQNGVVVLVTVTQPVDQPLAWSAIKQQNGEPAFTAYTDYAQGSRVFAFPTLGRAFVADEQWDAVFIQQCFVPMKLDYYMLAYGNFMPTEDPFIR